MVSKKKTMLHTAVTAIIFTVCLLMPGMCSADFGEWAWMDGDNDVGAIGIYGRQGVGSSANVPGSRNSSISWTDELGNMWLFGGADCFDCDNDETRLDRVWSDLWSYDQVTEEWTWMSGPDVSDQLGIYGTMGEPDGSNIPGARHSSVSWGDEFGDLWLFGGYGFDNGTEILDDNDTATGDFETGLLNDLWRYDIGTGEWTWVGGSDDLNQPGVYVDVYKGYPYPDHQPGARSGSISWVDKDGYLWMFGGYGYDGSGTEGWLNDLWVYNIASREWAWVSGSSARNQPGVFGEMGVPDAFNVPGSRKNSISWIDEEGNLWLFGGFGYDGNGSLGHLSDLWRYDLVERVWIWVSGSDMKDQIGMYDEPFDNPGCREGSISWIDDDGYLWLFGGFGQASTYSPIGGRLNDLWRYDPLGDNWTWVSGSKFMDQPGVYGTMGELGPFNVPGARQDSISWIDSLDFLWLFGGEGYDKNGDYGNLNDLWRFGTPPECSVDADCEDDDLFCTGAPQCWDDMCGFADGPCSGDTPVCDEAGDMCVECLDGSDCGFDYQCVENMCVKCGLDIKHKALSSAQLYKDRKITFKIYTVSFGEIDLGPDILILSKKVNTKKGIVKVKTIVPAGLRPQIIPVWVGECYGAIEITQ